MDIRYYSGENALGAFGSFLSESAAFSGIYCLCDENTRKHCLPLLTEAGIRPDRVIVIGAGERHKDLHTLSVIWQELLQAGADRQSLLINLGGGVITDLGGMAASTFMRGIRFVNLPTTVLGMVDASIGGKTGIDFGGAKNIAGTFAWPELTLAHFPFLDSLPDHEWKNGLSEMIKHQLIGDAAEWEHTVSFFNDKPDPASVKEYFKERIASSAAIKYRVVQQDPNESGIRACLNYGHTIGHGIEAWSLDGTATPLSHGVAVAAGMICEAYLSHQCCGLSGDDLQQIVSVIDSVFPRMNISREDRGHILEKIRFDKKKKDGMVRFALIAAPGIPRIGVTCSVEQISESLHYYAS